MKKDYTVSGMTCSACSSRVEKAVSKIDGVSACSVNLISGTLKVESQVDLTEKIITAVTSEGYGIKEGVERRAESGREKNLKLRILISIPLLVLLMYIAMGSMVGLPLPQIFKKPFAFALSQAIIALAIVVANFSYFIIGFKNLIKLKPNMDSLVALGASASFIYGIFAIVMIGLGVDVHTYAHNLYFEGSAMIVTLITLGKFLEEKSKNKTMSAVQKLLGLAPDTAVILQDGKEVKIKSSELKTGDVFLLKDGFSVPADGEIIEGDGYFNESMVTGESIPIYKSSGEKVICGTQFSDGFIKARATSVGEDSTIYKIVKLVEDANSTKVPIAGLADKISGIFVPIVIAIAILTLTIWLIISGDFAYSFNFAVSALVISCPCALGLATPAALMAGTGKSAENGILIKSGEALQNSAKTEVVVLDKTGTITIGKPTVEKIVSFGLAEEEFIKICASLEYGSSHVLSKPIIDIAKEKNIESYAVEDFESVRGKGVNGKINGEFYHFGNLALLKENCSKAVVLKAEEIFDKECGATILILSKKDEILGYMSINDQIKPSSIQAINLLKGLGIRVVMLTGDNAHSAKKVGEQLGVEYKAEVLPEDKHAQIELLKKNGSSVMMVGDGVNDAPALRSATVGVAIGAGTDIAVESADVVLIKNDLSDCVKTIEIGKAVMTNIKQNLFWAFFYNVMLIPLACGCLAWAGVTLNPMIASASMSLSSLFVVGNALRLRYFKFKEKGDEEMFFKKKEERVFVIDGMMCVHCQKRVENAFASLGIKAEINLKKKTATFAPTDLSDDEIKKVIEGEGYTVISMQ